MDRVVDHLFAFEGDGVIKDFPGNYSEYREWKDKELQASSIKQQIPKLKTASQVPPPTGEVRRGSSFKEKHEFEKLEQEMPALQKEKISLEEKMNTGDLSYDGLQKASERIQAITKLLDEKEMRWLELSERI